MKKILILSLASAMALTAAVAYAQPSPPPAGGPGDQGPGRHGQHRQMTRADFEALTDARVAAIQAGLKLTPDQQKLWGPVEQAVRARATARIQRMEQRRQQPPRQERPDFMQRLEQRSAMASQNAENLSALTNALKPFWASLDERQKNLLPILMRAGGREGRGWRHSGPHGRMGGMHGHGMMMQGRGPMQPDGQPPAPPAPQQQ